MKTKEYERPMFNQYIYLNYLFDHGENVIKAWGNLQYLVLDSRLITEKEAKRIDKLVIHHDESKMDPIEFWPYAYYFCGVENSKEDFKKAVQHHYDNNLHHHQSLRYYQGEDWKCYVIEMICDWTAMGMEMGDNAYLYYENNKDKIILPDIYLTFLLKVLTLIKERDKRLNEKERNPLM